MPTSVGEVLEVNTNAFFGSFFRTIHSEKYLILSLWSILAILVFIFGGENLDHSLKPLLEAENVQGMEDMNFYKENFAGLSDWSYEPVIIMCKQRTENCIVNSEVENFMTSLETNMRSYEPNILKHVETYWTHRNGAGVHDPAQGVLLDSAGAAAVAKFYFLFRRDEQRFRTVKHLRKLVDSANPDRSLYDAKYIGMSGADYESVDQSLKLHDEVSIWGLITLSLVYLVGTYYWKTVVIPIFTYFVTYMAARTILWLIIHDWIDIPAYFIIVMQFLAIVLNYSYTALFFTRLYDERQRGATHMNSIYWALNHSGQTIIFTAATFIGIFIGFFLIPSMDFVLAAFSYITLTVLTVLVVLTFLPCLLLAFPCFLRTRCDYGQYVSWLSEADEGEEPPTGGSISPSPPPPRFAPKFWTLSWAEFPCNVIILASLGCLFLGIGWRAFEIEQNIDFNEQHGYDYSIGPFADFAKGLPEPAYIVVTGDVPKITDKMLSALRELHANLEMAGMQEVESILSPHCENNETLLTFAPCYDSLFLGDSPADRDYQYFNSYRRSLDLHSTVVDFILPDAPRGRKAQKTLLHIRDHVLTLKHLPKFQYRLVHTTLVMNDTMHRMYAVFPWVFVCIVLAVSVCLGFALGSLFLVARHVLTLFFTLIFIYGIAAFVYEGGMFDWLDWTDVSKDIGPMYWVVPILTSFIAAGIILMYDLYLYLPTLNNRLAGYSTKVSVRQTMQDLMFPLLFVFMVMFVSSVILFASSVPMYVQMGFILGITTIITVAVLVVLVFPTAVATAGEYNWYFLNLPPPQKHLKFSSRSGSYATRSRSVGRPGGDTSVEGSGYVEEKFPQTSDIESRSVRGFLTYQTEEDFGYDQRFKTDDGQLGAHFELTNDGRPIPHDGIEVTTEVERKDNILEFRSVVDLTGVMQSAQLAAYRSESRSMRSSLVRTVSLDPRSESRREDLGGGKSVRSRRGEDSQDTMQKIASAQPLPPTVKREPVEVDPKREPDAPLPSSSSSKEPSGDEVLKNILRGDEPVAPIGSAESAPPEHESAQAAHFPDREEPLIDELELKQNWNTADKPLSDAGQPPPLDKEAALQEAALRETEPTEPEKQRPKPPVIMKVKITEKSEGRGEKRGPVEEQGKRGPLSPVAGAAGLFDRLDGATKTTTTTATE